MSDEVLGAGSDVDRQAFAAWQRRRLQRLTAADGWLALVGLHWLAMGDNVVGSGADAQVRLPVGRASERVGVLHLTAGGRVSFTPAAGAAVHVQAGPADATPAVGGAASRPVAESVALAHDAAGPPTVLRVGDLLMHVIARAGQYGLRIRDPNAATRTAFAGLETFPFDPAWCLPGLFVPYVPSKRQSALNVLGMVEESQIVGAVEFRRGDRAYRLDATETGQVGGLFVVFADATNGRQTYAPGRFLEIDAPDAAGHCVIDFNRAYNPPCAFTAFATCPLPSPENRLPFAVTAGEKTYRC